MRLLHYRLFEKITKFSLFVWPEKKLHNFKPLPVLLFFFSYTVMFTYGVFFFHSLILHLFLEFVVNLVKNEKISDSSRLSDME